MVELSCCGRKRWPGQQWWQWPTRKKGSQVWRFSFTFQRFSINEIISEYACRTEEGKQLDTRRVLIPVATEDMAVMHARVKAVVVDWGTIRIYVPEADTYLLSSWLSHGGTIKHSGRRGGSAGRPGIGGFILLTWTSYVLCLKSTSLSATGGKGEERGLSYHTIILQWMVNLSKFAVA